jgi:hypothetical protein
MVLANNKTLRLRIGVFSRYGACLFGGYLALFLVLHTPMARFPGAGVLARAPGYLRAAAHVNPVLLLNRSLGELGSDAAQLELLAAFALLLAAYLRLLRLVRHNPQSTVGLRAILGGVVLFSLPLLLLPYILSQDIYLYIMYGRLAAIHGANPAVTAPVAYQQDPLLAYLNFWRDEPSVYGPVWLFVSHGLTLVVERLGGALWLYLVAYKLLALLFHLASAALIWSLLGRWKPRQQSWGTLMYAWNPLALIELVGSAHNDAVVVCLIVLGLWLAMRDRWRWAIVALVAAALTKWIIVVLLPLYALLLLSGRPTWSARLRCAGQIAGIAALAAALLYAPYWVGARTLRPIATNAAATQSINSLGHLLVRRGPLLLQMLGVGSDVRDAPQEVSVRWHDRMDLYRMRPAAGPAPRGELERLARYEALVAWQDALLRYVQWFSKVIAGLAALAAFVALWRRPTFERFVAGAFWTLLVALLFVPWFWPWYLIWPLALAALLDWRPAGEAVAMFTSSALLVYVTMYRIMTLRAVYIFVPVLGVLAYYLWQKRLRAQFSTTRPVAHHEMTR